MKLNISKMFNMYVCEFLQYKFQKHYLSYSIMLFCKYKRKKMVKPKGEAELDLCKLHTLLGLTAGWWPNRYQHWEAQTESNPKTENRIAEYLTGHWSSIRSNIPQSAGKYCKYLYACTCMYINRAAFIIYCAEKSLTAQDLSKRKTISVQRQHIRLQFPPA